MKLEQLKLMVLLTPKISKSRKLRNVRRNFWKGRCMDSLVEKWQKKLTKRNLGIGYSRGDVKVETGALLCAAQEQALRTNYIKHHIDKSIDSPRCRMCGKFGESVQHIVSGCEKLAQKEYKRRHDNVAKKIHWDLCKRHDLEHHLKWYDHIPEGAIENDKIKLLWDINIQCDNVIEARRPDIVVIDKKERVCLIVDIAVPSDRRVEEKEQEKVEKYQDLKREIGRMWEILEVQLVPVVIGALGSVSKGFDKWIEKLDTQCNFVDMQKIALLGTARILRKILEM